MRYVSFPGLRVLTSPLASATLFAMASLRQIDSGMISACVGRCQPKKRFLITRYLMTTTLKWPPWIGKEYASSSSRTLIVGESFYLWEGEDEAPEILDNSNFLQALMQNNILRGMADVKQDVRAHRNFERAIFQTSHPSDAEAHALWNRLAYHVLVQRPLPNARTRPTGEDFLDGWRLLLQVIRELQPRNIIVWGVTAAYTIEAALQTSPFRVQNLHCHEPIGRTPPRTATLAGDYPIRVVFIHHPSKYFNWKKWGLFLREKLPEPFGTSG